MITMYEMNMTSALDANACLTPRGVTTVAATRTTIAAAATVTTTAAASRVD
jgi:hypothetical protein